MAAVAMFSDWDARRFGLLEKQLDVVKKYRQEMKAINEQIRTEFTTARKMRGEVYPPISDYDFGPKDESGLVEEMTDFVISTIWYERYHDKNVTVDEGAVKDALWGNDRYKASRDEVAQRVFEPRRIVETVERLYADPEAVALAQLRGELLNMVELIGGEGNPRWVVLRCYKLCPYLRGRDDGMDYNAAKAMRTVAMAALVALGESPTNKDALAGFMRYHNPPYGESFTVSAAAGGLRVVGFKMGKIRCIFKSEEDATRFTKFIKGG